ncbi:MAG: hypothetical protein N3D14_05035 [Aquificaceae bacterium]|nr:hypothetical protein [Aquificaceae bacterium]MCX8164741.1 hypothetical protein [Aquificaceae bacterium]
MEQEEKHRQENIEEEVERMRMEVFRLLELFLPPKEVRREVLKNLYTIELSFWRILKTLVDYEVGKLEQKMERAKPKERVKKIDVE